MWLIFFLVTLQCLAKRHLCVSDLWSDGWEKYICMKLGAWSFMGAFFSIQIGCGVKKFGPQTPWSENQCLVWELVFDLLSHRDYCPNSWFNQGCRRPENEIVGSNNAAAVTSSVPKFREPSGKKTPEKWPVKFSDCLLGLLSVPERGIWPNTKKGGKSPTNRFDCSLLASSPKQPPIQPQWLNWTRTYWIWDCKSSQLKIGMLCFIFNELASLLPPLPWVVTNCYLLEE